jgi:hypothetical protein
MPEIGQVARQLIGYVRLLLAGATFEPGGLNEPRRVCWQGIAIEVGDYGLNELSQIAAHELG